MTTQRWLPGAKSMAFLKRWRASNSAGIKLSLVRSGLAPEAAPGPVQPIKVMSARWSANPQATPAPIEAASGRTPHAAKPPFALPLLGDLARLIVFYNTRHTAQPGSRNSKSSDLRQLTKVALADVEVSRVSSLHELRLRVDASVNDPVYLLMQADRGAAEIRAGWGVKVELAFSMGTARIVETVHGRRDTHELGQMLRDGRELA